MQSDRDLVHAVCAGDPQAYAELVRRHQRAVVATAWRITGGYHAAQDVAQEAFVSAYRKLDSLREGAAFGGWILKITQRLAWRAHRRTPQLAQLREGDEPVGREDRPPFDDALHDVAMAVAQLPEQERTVVSLRYFEGHSVGAVAEITGRPLGTVTKQLSRAHRRLRAWLAEVNQ
ncbi:MAG TPA: sigma-70 family RNA polymerase sigma factor [Pirellulales bacterium]|nr:sigma-70 family RNA polymerase sigma factor [Pirellulales bacterium]